MRIRRAGVRDACGLAVLHVDSWRAAYEQLVPERVLEELSVDGREEAWREELSGESEGSWTLVAEREATLLGFCSLAAPSRDPDGGERTGEIAALYVDPGAWREGIGSRLIEVGLGELAGGGFEQVIVWILAGNTPAESFYREFGFAADGAEKIHERSGVTEFRLRRPGLAQRRFGGLTEDAARSDG